MGLFEGSYRDFRIAIYTKTSDVLIPTVMGRCGVGGGGGEDLREGIIIG